MSVVFNLFQGSNVQTFKVKLLSSILEANSRRPSDDESTIGTDELVPRTIRVGLGIGTHS
jgi:hypothetical protein